MKKLLIPCIFGIMILLTSCGQNAEFTDLNLKVPQITVTSSSLDKTGRLPAETAADKQSNNPLGRNMSPQVSWDAVEGASCYAVCMFDEDANWLHWFAADIKKTSLEQAEYTAKEQYVGPYPPQSSGMHHYRIEVFALKQAPDSAAGKMDAQNSYEDIVKHLNQVQGKSGIILARGHIIGTYANGDKTVNP